MWLGGWQSLRHSKNKFMTQTHNLTLSQHRSTLKTWLIALLVVLFVAVLEYANMLRIVRQGGELLFQPFLQLGAQTVSVLKRPGELVRVATAKYTYILDLELRYAESAAQLSELARLRQENQALRELLEGEQATPSGLLGQRKIAAVLSYAQPTVAVGTANGINEGNTVFIAGTVIGKVAKVTEHQSQLKLLNTYGEADVLLVQTETGVSGLLVGDGREVLIRELPIDAPIQVGQRIETSGQINTLPGLYLGRISAIRREEGAPTQTAVINQGVSFYRTTIVEVLP